MAGRLRGAHVQLSRFDEDRRPRCSSFPSAKLVMAWVFWQEGSASHRLPSRERVRVSPPACPAIDRRRGKQCGTPCSAVLPHLVGLNDAGKHVQAFMLCRVGSLESSSNPAAPRKSAAALQAPKTPKPLLGRSQAPCEPAPVLPILRVAALAVRVAVLPALGRRQGRLPLALPSPRFPPRRRARQTRRDRDNDGLCHAHGCPLARTRNEQELGKRARSTLVTLLVGADARRQIRQRARLEPVATVPRDSLRTRSMPRDRRRDRR